MFKFLVFIPTVLIPTWEGVGPFQMSENNPNGHFVFSGPNVKVWIAAGPRCHHSAPSIECLSRVELCGLRAHLFGWTTCNVSINMDIKLLQIGLVF